MKISYIFYLLCLTATEWMTSALPIGNGELGAMFFGGIGKEEGNFTIDLIWQNLVQGIAKSFQIRVIF